MNRAWYYPLKLGAMVAVVVLIGSYMARVSYAQHNHMMHSSTPQQAKEAKPVPAPVKETVSLQVIYASLRSGCYQG